MCRGMKWTWVLALSLTLGITSMAVAADDDAPPARSGNWFTRLFVRDKGTKESAAKKEEAAKTEANAPALAQQKAQVELMRRQEVCDKLRQIALQIGDNDLTRKADALDQRAWDVYVQRTGGTGGSFRG